MKIDKRLYLAIIVLQFAACGVNKAPTCSDSDVQELVLNISNEETLNQVFVSQLMSKNGYIFATAISRFSIDQWKNDPPQNYEVASNFTFERDYVLSIIAESENLVEEAGLKLDEIRTNDKNVELKKASCSASLRFNNGNKLPITYLAQETDQGQLYVEVTGL
ncbi:hypothetical protein [Thiorhodovibrio frisius]|uniref:Uncharacterized protein n=1 Tax=Thiorhodovibrio frisius TaxID=631362 RepID=H8Z567_9GAMM|nr:hypothetical protein [Thiorhodovibrio frisius]EIC20474.1 hypothetical protein Thi970DRAFT_04111 [Thiorhodovibrio frisius]WPL21215.1 hypothetical protein Thiofri_01326 [Thiorhodovibrio frisius]